MGHSTTPRRANRSVTTTAAAVALVAASIAMLTAAYAMKAATGFVLDDAVRLVTLITLQSVGLVLAMRRPGNRVGWIVCGLVGVMAAQALLGAFVGDADATRRITVAYTAALWVDGKSFLLLWAGVIALFLYFPTGELPSPRWRWAVRAAIAGITLAVLVLGAKPGPLREGLPLSATNPANPTALAPGAWERVTFMEPVTMAVVLAAFLASLGALVVRYRGADATTRLQIRWVVAAAVLFGVALFVDVVIRNRAEAWLPLADAIVGIAFAFVPAAVGIAVLRYRLYEIDRLINRTVVYALLTAVLAGAYAVAVTAMRAVTAPVTGDSAVAVAASTLAVAALFRPARSRIQRVVDRRFNRARYDAAKTVEAFSARLRDDVDLESLKIELVGVVCATMEPAGATLWVREAGR